MTVDTDWEKPTDEEPEHRPPDQDEDDERERRTPPDGAIGSCRRCNNEVRYNGERERWEHTGRGHAACFGK